MDVYGDVTNKKDFQISAYFQEAVATVTAREGPHSHWRLKMLILRHIMIDKRNDFRLD